MAAKHPHSPYVAPSGRLRADIAVPYIIERKLGGATYEEIAEELGVTWATIKRVCKGKIYKRTPRFLDE